MQEKSLLKIQRKSQRRRVSLLLVVGAALLAVLNLTTEMSQWNVQAEQYQGVWKDWIKERTPLSSFVAPSLTIVPKLFAQAGVTFTVNSTADTVDANIGDGICATAGAVCTLRAALAEANATPAADIITAVCD